MLDQLLTCHVCLLTSAVDFVTFDGSLLIAFRGQPFYLTVLLSFSVSLCVFHFLACSFSLLFHIVSVFVFYILYCIVFSAALSVRIKIHIIVHVACPSVCSSDRPSHGWITQKRLTTSPYGSPIHLVIAG